MLPQICIVECDETKSTHALKDVKSVEQGMKLFAGWLAHHGGTVTIVASLHMVIVTNQAENTFHYYVKMISVLDLNN
ncbi:hypothetical protein C5B42_03960 [Candidatus Cerribacteria bacterium 'Amazon FNV 2010 28 9']|uniref:Uncharacterized protein n=1 Tax=Candidatus Cerribacteria bacterium 'Amazon FNV 2010 28 9' TaxID=2081795 RepID=A0A317JQW9_9BACT|nr:MAG: hypothetical protein C5B42_03960 [Candidatus Cerribacteria bacterium 'Amazon FNV 2010 28 9']